MSISWNELQVETELAKLSLGGCQLNLPSVAASGKQDALAARFVDDEWIAGVDCNGWLRLWQAESGVSKARVEPSLTPLCFPLTSTVVTSKDWIIGTSEDMAKVMAYRFPCAPGRWLGRTCNTGRRQIFASTNRQSLWCFDLRTMESDEILFEQLLLDEEGFRLLGYREDADISGLEVCDSYFHEDSLVLNFRDCAVGFEPFVETRIELPSFATTGIHTLCRGALDCRLRPNHPGQFACYSRERRTSIWTLALVQDVRNPIEIALPEIVGLDFSSDGSLVAVACSNREILVIDFVTSEIVCRGELPITAELHYDGIWFDFSPTNRYLLAYTHNIALVAKLV